MLQRTKNRLLLGTLGAALPMLALADIADQVCRDDPRPALCKARVCDKHPAACGAGDPSRPGTSNVILLPGPGEYNKRAYDQIILDMRKAGQAAAALQGLPGAKQEAPRTSKVPSR